MKQKGRWVGGLGLVLVAAMLLGAFSASGGASVTVSEADAGRTIQLRRGDTLIVELRGNPSTGYSWTVEAAESDVLNADGEPEFAPESDKLGAGGMYTIKFAAERTGSAVLKLVYHRPWDKETPPARTFEIVITVQ
jgi:inhibitor of cysteine peptidase